MRNKLFAFLSLLVFFNSCETKNKQAPPSAIDHRIDMEGLDSLKLGMTKAELEAMLKDTFKLKHISVDGGPYDTFNTKYNGANVTIYLYESDEKTVATLYGLQTSDTTCKTKEGIGVGAEKIKVIDAYSDYKKYIAPVYETYPERSKTKSVIAVVDTAGSRAMLFHIINRKVSSVELSSYYEFD